ncbi:hypothetical protein [Lacimicrobium alkaliphilum]|uniref:Topoisomerase II n=1 Tax=Lacimicrobium alkaliphilum TaxID=1526571 RepID=A0ABQ1QX85_9ALTE|nr:hypothetical protein [Lacimicrobium alkaliphilum]GGD50631.1 hypothetical protein GCM10011357_03190 [Lacimicrobium alkaliphilum]
MFRSSLVNFKPLFVLSGILLSAGALADDEDDALAKAQAQMNAEVMSKPFLAERPEEVDKYIESMLKQNVKPKEYQGQYWRPGYTCRDLLRYNWTQYRNCRYYYRYHGHYYR